MSRDYGDLMNLAVELKRYEGYLNTREQKERTALVGRYAAAKNAFVYDLLREKPSAEDAVAEVDRDLDEIAAHSNEDWLPIYDEVRGELLAQIERDGARKPWQRTLRRRAPWIVVALLLIGYFGARLYASTPVSAPMETRAGLEQRAAALHKVLRYNDWSSTRTRRGGVFKDIFLWPIQPSEAEIEGASQLGGMVLAGAAALVNAGQACGLDPAVGEQLSDEQEAMMQSVADHLSAPGVRWRMPPAFTVLDPIRKRYACRTSS